MSRTLDRPTLNVTSRQIVPGLYLFEDTCNVYVVCDEHEAIAIDFGSGAWLPVAAKLGLPKVTRVYLTHHHPDQCAGLQTMDRDQFEVHAPTGEAALYQSKSLASLKDERGGAMWFPEESYSLLNDGLPADMLKHDMAGFDDHYWLSRRIRFIHTPGHGRHAISIVLDHNEQQLVFCGDAAHGDATIHQLYHLEWDHWTAGGINAAKQGVERLAGLGMDWLLPSHGPVINDKPNEMLSTLAGKLEQFAQAKGSICAGEKDHYLTPMQFLPGGAIQLLPDLYWFHNGGYLLVSQNNEALITDPFGDLKPLDALLAHLKKERPELRVTAQCVTHYHADHCSAVDRVREQYGAPLYLHPKVAEMLARAGAWDVPYLDRQAVTPDHLWPEQGQWSWNEFTFDIAHMPGQTWWHCGFMTTINHQRVLFGGDSFQPASRWNGTGGFCSINGCRFDNGFEATAQTILNWQPDIIVNGHGTWCHFAPSYFQKVIEWSQKTQAVITALCPQADIEKHYHLHHPVSD